MNVGSAKRLAALCILMLTVFACAATAGTVTLTSTCYGGSTNSTPYISFNLSATGNDTATDLAITPVFPGLQFNQTTRQVNVLSAGESAGMLFGAVNLTYKGSYAGYFAASYVQGGQTFFAVFPCEVQLGGETGAALVYINAFQQTWGRVVATVVNNYGSQVSVAVDNIVPYEFSSSPTNTTLVLAPGESKIIMFNMTGPRLSNASFGAAVALNYVLNGTHYSQASSYTISAQQSGGVTEEVTSNLPYIGVGGAILVILALLALSVVKGRKQQHKTGGSPETIESNGKTKNQHSDTNPE